MGNEADNRRADEDSGIAGRRDSRDGKACRHDRLCASLAEQHGATLDAPNPISRNPPSAIAVTGTVNNTTNPAIAVRPPQNSTR